MEEPHAGKGHDHAVFVGTFDHKIVPYGASRLRHVGDAALFRPLEVVAEGEEGIGAQGDACDGVQIRSLLFVGKGLRLTGKILLPIPVGADVLLVSVDIAVDDIVPVRSPQCGEEGEAQNLFVFVLRSSKASGV